MKHTILDLLVQSENSMIRDEKMRNSLIESLSFIINNIIHVTSLFYIERKYEKFDPHVGDTACQIRACFIVDFSKRTISMKDIEKRISDAQEMKNRLIDYKSKLNQVHEKNNGCSIKEMINIIGIDFYLTEEEKILFQSYFLTFFKKVTAFNMTVIDFDAISFHLGVSRKVSKKLTRHYQLSLASYSCNTIIQWAESGSHLTDLSALKALTQFDDDDRQVLPCYFYTKIIYNYALEQGISILVISKIGNKLLPLYFKPNQDKTAFDATKVLTSDLHKPCITIIGGSQAAFDNYLQRFILTGIKNILLSAMACHPQYSGKRLSPYNQDLFKDAVEDNITHAVHEEWNYMRLLGNALGCCYENPTLFIVEHVFCGTIYNQFTHFELDFKQVLEEIS